MFGRHLEIHDGKAIMIKHRPDISVIMIVELLDEQLGSQSRRAAERVVNHDDILDAEYVVHGRHRLQSEGGASTRVGLGKYRPRMANPMAGFVENVFPRIDLVPQILGNGLWDIDRPRVKSVDHKCLHRDGLVRALEGVHIEPG